jgi:hypothetical protein
MTQTFSRAYLQGLHKQEYIEKIINSFISSLHTAAASGITTYMYVPAPTPHATMDDFVAAFKLKFPDCDISYQEVWVALDLKKGILIDWS